MNDPIAGILTALVAGALGIVSTWLVFRGTSRTARATERVAEVAADSTVAAAEADATTAFLAGQKQFQEFTENLVRERVAEAVAPLERRLSDLKDEFTRLSRETDEMHDAVRAYATQLWLWNLRGRPGDMPELPRPILVKLNVAHLSSAPADIDEDTIPLPPAAARDA